MFKILEHLLYCIIEPTKRTEHLANSDNPVYPLRSLCSLGHMSKYLWTQRNDRAIIRQICSIKPEDVATVRSSELLAKLQIEDLNLILRERRLCWFGHVERSSGAIKTACDIQIEGRRSQGGPS